MSKLVDSLIEKLISLSPNEKELIGTTIVELLSGDATKQAINLSPRRGNADGGIDGRIKVISVSIQKLIIPNGITYERGEKKQQDAAVNIKIQKDKFSPEQFGYFKDSLERENIFVGIIITAKGLAPDVERRIIDINNERIYSFYHLPIKNIILWNFEDSVIEFECGDISNIIREKLVKYISNSSRIEQ